MVDSEKREFYQSSYTKRHGSRTDYFLGELPN